MNNLNKDQLALLNGSNDIEDLSMEEMYKIAGGLTGPSPSCPYGQHAQITNGTAPCTAYGVCTITYTYYCVSN